MKPQQTEVLEEGNLFMWRFKRVRDERIWLEFLVLYGVCFEGDS
jgi:hypothetical protein